MFFYVLLRMHTPMVAVQSELTFISVDTECNQEDLPSGVAERNEWQCRVKGIHTVGTP